MIRSKLGLYPTTPQYPAGLITDPHVCVPIAKSQNSAATAAPEPLEDPPGVCRRFLGFLVSPGSEIANSAVTVFAIKLAPAFSKLFTTLAC